MNEELILETTAEEVDTHPVTEQEPLAEEPVQDDRIPAEKWWNDDDAEWVDLTPQLPVQPIVEQSVPPMQPQYTYQHPAYQQPVQPMPQYSEQPVYQPYPTQFVPQKNGMSLASLILGIAALLIGFFPIFGWAADITAIVLGAVSKSKGDKTARATLGIIFGAIGAVCGFLFLIIAAIGAMEDGNYYY